MEAVEVAPFSFATALRRLSERRGDQVAFVTPERSLTFSELHERSSRLAGVLRGCGVAPGDHVAALVRNGCEFFEIAFAVSQCDAVLVALNWRLAAPEIAPIVAEARPTVVLAEPDLIDLLPAAVSDRLIRLGEDYEARLRASSDADLGVEPRPEAGMLTLYSSGTTGRPKGVMLTNENLSYIEVMAHRLFRMDADSVHLVVAPLFHIGGAATGLTTTLLGGRTILPRDVDPEDLLETIERERVTHAFFVPAVIQRLIDAPSARHRDLSSLRYVAYGAAPMSETLLRNAIDTLGCGFIGCYGMTETSATVVSLAPEEHVSEGPRSRLLRSVGRSLPWHEVRVTDMQTGEEAAPGQIGEIWVRSPMNMKGYFNQPEATAQTLTADGWLRTGDGAYSDEDGYIFLTDRLKDMIISGGENVYPAEVENALAGHPDVAEAAVIGVPSERWGETVKAIVALRPGSDCTAEELIAYTRGELAHYKCPTSVEIVMDIPRNPSGKIIKRALRERYAGADATVLP